MSAHTPGPWTVSTTGKFNEVKAVVADGALIADVAGPTRRQKDANADLIATAPDLLRLLKVAESWLLELSGPYGRAEVPRPILDGIRAGIARAEGQS